MPRRGVQIRGLGNLERKLQGIRADMKGGMATKAGRAGAKPVKDEMAIQVPRRTGDLADSIMDDVLEEGDSRAKIGIGPDEKHFYGGIIELKGDPWMRPSLDAREGDVAKTVGKVLKGEILKHTR